VDRWEEEGGRPLAADPGLFRLMRTDIKRWPAEYHSQAGIAAALDLRARGLRPETIDRVTIETFRVAVEIIGAEPEKWLPATRETADHSMPYLVAVALLDGEVTERQFAPERIAGGDVRHLMARTRVVERADLSALYPWGIPTIVRVTTASGAWESRVDFPPGHSRNPLTDAQVAEKFTRMAAPLLGRKAEAVLQRLWTLESVADVRELMPALVVDRTPHGR
jgi:2-methylcitrate dehydratase